MRDKITLLVVTFLIIFVVLEIGVRLSGVVYEDAPKGDLLDVSHATYNPFLIFGPLTNTEVDKGEYGKATWNSQGFRLDYNLEKKKNNEYRIFVLGGSTTGNMGNEENIHYAGEAEKILGEKNIINKKITVINAGRAAYSTAQNLIRFHFDILPLEPDVITIMNNYNDLNVNFFPGDERENYSNKYLHEYYARTKDTQSKAFLKNSKFLVFIVRSIRNIRDNLTAETFETDEGEVKVISNMRFTDKEIPLKYAEAFKRNLSSIAQIGKANGIKVVFMSQPILWKEELIALNLGYKPYNEDIFYPRTPKFKGMFDAYNDIIEETAREEGVYFIDMHDLFGHNPDDFFDMVHYTARGIRKFGEIYSNELEKIILDE